MAAAGKWIYTTGVALFILCIMIQFFLAGLSVFVDPVFWERHVFFVHLFGFNLLVVLLIVAFINRHKWVEWLGIVGLFLLLFLMYFTANASELEMLRAAHPVLGVLLLLLAVVHFNRSMDLIKKERNRK